MGSFATGQATSPARKPVPWKRYCQTAGGFCFKYPSSWTILGEIFAGNGVVVAPPQKLDQSLWDEITVARIAPAPDGDEKAIGLNGVIERATTGLREAGQNFETLQRQQRMVDHKPAEMLKVQYREKSTGRDWIEELVFIEGPDNEIYSVALKANPRTLPHLELVFASVLESWMLPEPEPPAASADESAPAPAAKTPPPTGSPH
jgi:hypothetical protein